MNINLDSLDSIRQSLVDYVQDKYGTIYNTTTAGFVLDLLSVLVGYKHLADSELVRQSSILTADAFEVLNALAANYGYLLDPADPYIVTFQVNSTEALSASKWDVVGTVGNYYLILTQDTDFSVGSQNVDFYVGYLETDEEDVTEEFTELVFYNKGYYLVVDELTCPTQSLTYTVTSDPFQLLSDDMTTLVLRGAGSYWTRVYFGNGLVGAYPPDKIRYVRVSCDNDVTGVDLTKPLSVFNQLTFSNPVVKQSPRYYPDLERFRTSLIRYPYDKRLVTELDYENWTKLKYPILDVKAYVSDYCEPVRIHLLANDFSFVTLLQSDIEQRRLLATKVEYYQDDPSTGSEVVATVYTDSPSNVQTELDKLLYIYYDVGTVIDDTWIEKKLAKADIPAVVEVSNPISITNIASVTGEALGTGDGSTLTFSGTLNHYPAKTSTITIHYIIGGTAYTATDDGNGNISGTDVSGTITYSTGVWTLTFTTAPDSGTSVAGDYTYYLSSDTNFQYGFIKTFTITYKSLE